MAETIDDLKIFSQKIANEQGNDWVANEKKKAITGLNLCILHIEKNLQYNEGKKNIECFLIELLSRSTDKKLRYLYQAKSKINESRRHIVVVK